MIDALAASIDDASDVAGWHLESGRFFFDKIAYLEHELC